MIYTPYQGINIKIMLTIEQYFKRRFGEKIRETPISLSGELRKVEISY